MPPRRLFAQLELVSPPNLAEARYRLGLVLRVGASPLTDFRSAPPLSRKERNVCEFRHEFEIERRKENGGLDWEIGGKEKGSRVNIDVCRAEMTEILDVSGGGFGGIFAPLPPPLSLDLPFIVSAPLWHVR